MAVTLSSRLEIPRARFKEKNKVVNDGSTLSIDSIHSNDEDNAQDQGYNIKACNELIKLNIFDDLLRFAYLTK